MKTDRKMIRRSNRKMKINLVIMLLVFILSSTSLLFLPVFADHEQKIKVVEPTGKFKGLLYEPPKISGSPEEVDIWPGVTIIYTELTFAEYKWAFHHYLNATPQEVGWYHLEIWISMENPSKKWRSKATYPTFMVEPFDMIVEETFNSSWAPSVVFLQREESLTNAMIIITEFEVVQLGGYIEYWQSGNALITDLNGDKIVDITDIVMVTIHYGEAGLWGPEDPQWMADVQLDFMIDIWDIVHVAIDFGRTIPP